jgi:UDP-N-acetylmuramoyl-tripeptide--D-alanyl-D-alanine ligase
VTLTIEQAARATHGELRNQESFPRQLRVVTDTRTIRPGDTFLALRGERFDGHTYVRDALAKGAAAIVVDDPQAIVEGVPALAVRDTKRAYMDLAAAARELFTGQVIGITGSAGKTTTKHLLAQLLSAHYGSERVLASPANENNEIGVSKLLLSASDQSVLVVEMGARHEGEIAELVEIARPQTGVLTNIGEAHLEIFGSRESLARTKWGLFSQGARAVLNARDSESALRAATLPAPPLWFGTGEPMLPGVWIRNANTLLDSSKQPAREYPVDVRLPGQHNFANLAAALAAALLLDVPVETLTRTIPSLALPAGRYETIELASGTRLIYDAYNANASGMMAALDAFVCEPASCRIAVLASMAELGADAPAMHERVGAHAVAAGVDVLLAGGEYAASLISGALAAGLPRDRVVTFEDNAQAGEWLRAHAGAKDVVLLKGSRKYKMEEIVSILRQAQDDTGDKA